MGSVFDDAAAGAGFVLDDAQALVAERLGRLVSEVSRHRGRFRKPPRGVHLWGPVGRGKSWLASVAFDAADVEGKRRLHFHDFFRDFHAAYSRHRAADLAVDLAVAELLDGCRFLCFDEFHVHDPGDAVLLGRLLRSLFERRVVLLTTSNHPPGGLLPEPLYHHLVEPTVALLEREVDVVELNGPVDHRRQRGPGGPRSGFERGAYLCPGTGQQVRALGLAPPSADEARVLEVGGRALRAAAVREDLVWFDFSELCAGPTSAADYLPLADDFPTWVVSGVPRLGDVDEQAAQRFAYLVDVLCDRDARLVLVGEAPLAEVLRGNRAPRDVDRLESRLSLLSVAPDGPTGA
ncbi:cell division protein ZapE [Umezawaea beigongshangensis]|uniref:cell division protein ZapE n=1 Tax=Umezawaea beigongshangensis TaxID=2780383 RepID=UPI0018F19261|nr:cell division protein ZapE [Umezawaea beigongshangensis]